MPTAARNHMLNKTVEHLALRGTPESTTRSLFGNPDRMKEHIRVSDMDEGLMDMMTEFLKDPSALNDDKSKLMTTMESRMKKMYTKDVNERKMVPEEVPAKSRVDVLKTFNVAGTRVALRQAVIGRAWSYSQSTLGMLTRVPLRNMLASKIHKGCFLLGRIVSDAGIRESIEFILEDPEGNAAKVCLYNYPQYMLSERDVKSIFQKGTVWVIREPTYKRFILKDSADPIVSIDSPSDIVPVYSTDEVLRNIRWMSGASPRIPRLLASVEEYRLRGAHEFKAENWLYAAVCYTDGLQIDKDSLIMRLNRSEAYLRLGWYNSAFHDARQVLDAGIEDAGLLRKAICRAARASYYSKDYQRTIAYAERLPEDIDCGEWIRRTKERIREKETGEYDWCAIYRETLKDCPRPDAADYYGPIEVKELDPLRGRGVYATRDIKTGELLLASKPIASWFREDELPGMWDYFSTFNIPLGEILDRSAPTVLAFVAQSIWDNEELAEFMATMYAGPGIATRPYVETKVTEGKPLSHPLKSNVDINIAHLERVVSFDTFMLDNAVKPVFRGAKFQVEKCGYALYGLASFCNHSCLPSAYRSFFGDFLTIRASRDIKKGEEITVQYLPDDRELMMRRFKCSKMRFLCDCLLCKADAEDGEQLCAVRKDFVKELDFKNLKADLYFASLLIGQVNRTYLDTPARRACGVKPELWDMFTYRSEIAKCFIKEDRRTDPFYVVAVECLMSALEAQGLRILDKSTYGPVESNYHDQLPIDTSIGPVNLVHCCVLVLLEIATIFDWKKDAARAEAWLKVAVWVDDIFAGGGVQLFKLRYAQILKEMELVELVEKVL